MRHRKKAEPTMLAEKRIRMEKIVFLAGTKDSSFFLPFPAVLILRGSLQEAKSPAEKVLRLIQTFAQLRLPTAGALRINCEMLRVSCNR
jgi:hypothetical protein